MHAPLSIAADPAQVIAAFLAAGAPVEPEPVFLAWLLSLEASLDPAEAASILLAALPIVSPPIAGSARLLAMLEDTTRWSRPALAALAARHPRRVRPS